MIDAKARTQRFRDLHREGCFVMPNPWDGGTTRWLAGLGFSALATTSAGFAFTQARADQDVPLPMMLPHIAEIVRYAADIPVNADFENAYADEPEAAAQNILACVETGVAGVSIEDATGRESDPLYPFDLAVARVKAVRRAIDDSRSGVVLTARAECFLTGHPDKLAESIRRLRAYADAGADVLYAPGPRTLDEFRFISNALPGKAVNGLVYMDMGLSVADLASAGIRRISIGAAMARAAWASFIDVAAEIREKGTFTGFARNSISAPLNPFFADDLRQRGEHGR
ncbi:MAG: isocitrate lyase/PEP mutase family protein [Beijerinckiaceae bacterium]